MDSFNIFGVKIFLGDYKSLLNVVLSNQSLKIGYAHFYMLNMAKKDEAYRRQLESLDIVHADGIGVDMAIRFLSDNKVTSNRLTGSDLYFQLLKIMEEKQLSLYILGEKESVLNLAISVINQKFPNINLVGTHHGFIEIGDKTIVADIIIKQPDILLVGLGANTQENWINRWDKELTGVTKIAVGGGIRVIAGDRSRGPKIFQHLGLEWFIRLVTEPTYVWRRYLLGIPEFIYNILKQKYQKR